MSVVLAYVSENISLISTDTRITYGNSITHTISHSDDNRKLYNLKNLGWVAGVGASTFIDIFKEKISSTEIHYVDQLKDIFQECYMETQKLSIYSKEILDITGIVASWKGLSNNGVKLRVGVFNKEFVQSASEGLPIVENNNIFILPPYSFIKSPKLMEDLNNEFSFYYEWDSKMYTLLEKIIEIQKYVTYKADSVSHFCEIGMEIITPEYEYEKIRVKGELTEILNSIQNGTIINKMEYIK